MSIFVSRTLDYTIRSLIQLARNEAGGPLSLRALSERADIPRSYLAKLMSTLVKAGLVESDAGVNGGYRLARPAHEISLKEVYESVEGDFRTIVCNDPSEPCTQQDDCTQVPVWVALEREILQILDRRRLSEFVHEASCGTPLIAPEGIPHLPVRPSRGS